MIPIPEQKSVPNPISVRHLWQIIRTTLELIRFSHTLFALPFALGAMWAAAHGWPGWRLFALIVIAMVTARSTAMAVNRLADRHIDARNPRTSNRPLQSGRLSTRYVVAFTLLMMTLFFIVCAAINDLTLRLAPVALFVLCGYSFTKRFTSWSHLFLGAALGLSPLGAQAAIQGTITLPFVLLGCSVLCWVAGFDILYALQDIEVDRAQQLHSVPARFGIARALWISRGLHALSACGFFGFGLLVHLDWPYFIGAALMTLGLIIEQALITPHDLSKLNMAFFTANGWISCVFLGAVVVGTQ